MLQQKHFNQNTTRFFIQGKIERKGWILYESQKLSSIFG